MSVAEGTVETTDSPDPDWRAAGERIDALLDASSAGGAVARDRAEELVRLVANLYGAGLERVLEIMYDQGHLNDAAVDALCEDDLVSSLLLVHGLHPYDLATRVEQALERVRPYLGSHGGDVKLVDITDEGVVRLRLLGSCDGCPSSSVTLKLAVEGAIETAAPDVTGIEVEEDVAASKASGLIPVETLRSRLVDSPGDQGSAWAPVPLIAELAEGSVATVIVSSTAVLVARIGATCFAFLDRCARCDQPMEGAVLARRLGAAKGEAVLRCPRCQAHYDVRRAGACLEDEAFHLTPLPLLTEGDITSVSIPVPVSA